MEDPIEVEKKRLKAELETELGVSSAWQPQRRLRVWRGSHPIGEYPLSALRANPTEVRRVIREQLALLPPADS
jgi:hypothetical protein